MLARAEGVIKQARSKMSKPFVSLMDKKEYRHTLATGNGLLEMAENSLDERQLTHVPLINFFIQLAIKYTAADAYSHYYTEVKDLIKKMTAKDKIRGIRTMEAMSGKQAHETVYLRIKDIHYSLEPTDEHEARAAGFSGERCPSCKSWRTEREPDATNTGRWYICIHCDHKFERKQPVPFTKPNAVVIDEAFITSHMSIERSAGVRSF
jgi:transposase-like protein